MPEAPTIKILAEEARQFIGQVIESVDGSVKPEIRKKAQQKEVTDIRTYGKQLLIILPDFTISVHLMLFGSYRINDSKPGKLTLGLKFKGGELNFYASVVKLIGHPLDETFDWRTEVMNQKFDADLALTKLQAMPDTLICDALLDQKIFTGVGNKIKDEVLFAVRLHPLNRINDIPEKKLKDLIKESVRYSFQRLEWLHENVADTKLSIHYQAECPRDKVPVVKQKIGKTARTSYFCDKCQQTYGNDDR